MFLWGLPSSSSHLQPEDAALGTLLAQPGLDSVPPDPSTMFHPPLPAGRSPAVVLPHPPSSAETRQGRGGAAWTRQRSASSATAFPRRITALFVGWTRSRLQLLPRSPCLQTTGCTSQGGRCTPHLGDSVEKDLEYPRYPKLIGLVGKGPPSPAYSDQVPFPSALPPSCISNQPPLTCVSLAQIPQRSAGW